MHLWEAFVFHSLAKGRAYGGRRWAGLLIPASQAEDGVSGGANDLPTLLTQGGTKINWF